MAQYTYYFYDLLTNTQLGDLPLYGVNLERRFNGVYGNMTGSVKLGRGTFLDQYSLDCSIPGRTVMYVDRDGTLIGGWIVWTRTYQSQSRSLQLQGQEIASYVAKRRIDKPTIFNNHDLREVVRLLWQQLLGSPYSNINVSLPGTFPLVKGFTQTYQRWDMKYYDQAIADVVGRDDGPEWFIDVQWSAGVPIRQLILDYTLGASVAQTNLVFQYPGSITNFWFPESASQSATRFAMAGSGEGSVMKIGEQQASALLNGGYPLLDDSGSNKDVNDQVTLDRLAAMSVKLESPPIVVPTFEIKPDKTPVLGSWGMGDYCIVDIEDVRFPQGYRTTARIVGWDITPPSADSTEQAKLVMEGQQ